MIAGGAIARRRLLEGYDAHLSVGSERQCVPTFILLLHLGRHAS
jgi:hypothetical protein